jgi:hypothetical protein
VTAAVLAIVLQALDALTYAPALARYPHGESNPLAAATSLDAMLGAKLVGIAACVVILVAVRRYRPLYLGAAAFAGIVGGFGAATNIIGGGLL